MCFSLSGSYLICRSSFFMSSFQYKTITQSKWFILNYRCYAQKIHLVKCRSHFPTRHTVVCGKYAKVISLKRTIPTFYWGFIGTISMLPLLIKCLHITRKFRMKKIRNTIFAYFPKGNYEGFKQIKLLKKIKINNKITNN